MILVTGAAGKTGRALLRALAGRGQTARAWVHRLPPAGPPAAAEVVSGDLLDPAAWQAACAGVRAVYLICPNMSPDEAAIGRLALAAARAAGVQRFVYHSVLHPQTEAMPHHWNKLRVEAAVFEAGLDFTLLQPAPYMQNLLAYWHTITGQGVYAVPYPPAARLSLIDLDDLAEAAARALTEPEHAGATYELCGTGGLSQADVAKTLAAALDRPVRAEQTPLDAWERGARAGGLNDYAVATLLKMFRYYADFGLWGSPRVLQNLLGRAPTTLAEFAVRQARRSA